jgi:hypothetical protein
MPESVMGLLLNLRNGMMVNGMTGSKKFFTMKMAC